MNILITGVPGTGKTTIAKELAERFKPTIFEVINDKDFSIKNKLGSYGKSGEYEVSIPKLNKKIANLLRSKVKKNRIFEGHLWSELSEKNLKKMDFVFVLDASEVRLRAIMKRRKYNALKLEENVFCQLTDYIPSLLKKKKISFNRIKITSHVKTNVSRIESRIIGETDLNKE
jgi:broad-specificity NMP kinase